METIKDFEGNIHPFFEEPLLDDDKQMGENITDFEILQILSENENDESNESTDNFTSSIAKVRSLNNHKIYAIKKIELKNKNKIIADNCSKEMNKLITLNNPHILKYYKVIMDKNYNFYLIMEFMNNAEINDFIKAHQILNKNIKEEEIWNILLQCVSALKYLHKQNLGNLGIHFYNIFMNNEQNVKISIFNKPTFNQNYDLKNDIYSLGKYFYIMCSSQDPDIKAAEHISQIPIKIMNNPNYSKELMNIIYLMIKHNPNERPDANNLYNLVKQEYVKKYSKNTSINAILRCLYSFSDFNKIITNKSKEFNEDKHYINYLYYMAINALFSNEDEKLKKCIEEFRIAIASENSKLDGNKEIDPLYFLSFLFAKMHKETNKKDINNELGTFDSLEFNGEEEDKTNKDQMLYNFVENFYSNFNSPISDLFFGLIKTKKNCKVCRIGNYSFSNFCFIIFDISNKSNNEEFNLINDGFRKQHDNEKELAPIYCERCLSYQKHIEFNRYYMINGQVIIIFNRGNNYENNSNINFDESLNLENYIEKKDSPKNYYLTGCIKRENEKFIFYARDPSNMKLWYIDDRQFTTKDAPINQMKNNGQIIMLFYNIKENKKIGNKS